MNAVTQSDLLLHLLHAAVACHWFDNRLTYGRQRRRWIKMPVAVDEVDLIISVVDPTVVEVTCLVVNNAIYIRF